MTKKLKTSGPARFSLTSLADILPARDPIFGEDLGSLEGFREGMTRSLVPLTPYECVIAESVVGIEWELIQHGRLGRVAVL